MARLLLTPNPRRVRGIVAIAAAMAILFTGTAASWLDAAGAEGCEHGNHATSGHDSNVAAPGHHMASTAPAQGQGAQEALVAVSSECDHCPQESCAVNLACGAVAFALRSQAKTLTDTHHTATETLRAEFVVPPDVPTTHQTPPPKIAA